MADKQISTTAIQLPASYEWYREQIAGHHPSVVKNGEHQIGPSLIFIGFRCSCRNYRIFIKIISGRNTDFSINSSLVTGFFLGLIKEVGSETLLKPVQEGVRGVCEVCLL